MQNVATGKSEPLLDPNALSSDGTVALSTKRVSENAEFVAYGLSSSGSDWITIKVLRVHDRVTLPDTLSWVRLLKPEITSFQERHRLSRIVMAGEVHVDCVDARQQGFLLQPVSRAEEGGQWRCGD